MAGNTPFKRWKREVHEGGVADPCIVHWPGGQMEAGAIRHQFAHAIDVFPTILELTGVAVPATIDSVPQSHIDGVSFSYVLGERAGAEAGRHLTQHFEMFGSRAIYHDGWKAVTFHPVGPLYPDGLNPNAPFDDDIWELYHVAEDVSETRDLAGEHPDRLRALIARWWVEAEGNQVLPLDNRILWALVNPKPDARRERDQFRYFQNGAQVPESVAVNVRNRSHALIIECTVPDGVPPEGTLLAMGSGLGGWTLQFRDGRPRYLHNLYGKERHEIAAALAIGPGPHSLRYDFTKDDGLGGTGVLRCDGEIVAEGSISRFTPQAFNGVGVGLTCGYEWGPAVGDGYSAPDFFNGTIHRAVVETTGPILRDPMAEIEAILAQQ
jgi:arylsulfatase